MKKLISAVLLLLSALAGSAQAYETIHFHFDKEAYLPGETVWFKAYQYNNTRPGVTSTNLYTALYTEQGRLLEQKQYPFFESTASGDFVLPDSVSGNFIFRAFTKTLLQQDSAAVYYQLIAVAGAAPYKPAAAGNARLEFYPEGGELVAGLSNFMGLRSTYDDGRPAALKGVIKNGTAEVAAFETGPAGMTIVQWTPEAGQQYTAEWTNEKGQAATAVLPPVKSSGVLLHAELTDKGLFYMVSKNSTAADLNTLQLVAQQGADVVYKAELRMDKTDRTVSSFSTDSAAAGLMQVSLLSSTGQLLAQRTLYVNSAEAPLDVVVTQLTDSTAPRQKNLIEIEVADTVKASLSVSIADAAFYTGSRAPITEGLLLGNARKSGIRLPPPGDGTQAEGAGLYTLNKKWPRPASGSAKQQPAAADNFLDLRFTSSKNIAQDEAMTAIINDKKAGRQFVNILPAANTFSKSGLVFFDSVKIYYQLQKNKDMVDAVKPVTAAGLQNPATIVPPVMYSAAAALTGIPGATGFSAKQRSAAFNGEQTLQEVKVKSRSVNSETKRLQELDQKYSTGQLRGTARGFQLNVVDDPDAENEFDIYNYITRRVAGLAVISTSGGGKRLIRLAESRILATSPLLFLDEVEVTNDVLQNVPIIQIAYIKYIPGIVIGSFFRSADGVVLVYTKKGDEDKPAPKNMRTAMAKGYSTAQQFFQPDYSSYSPQQADNRTTLYWNPYVLTDAQNRKFTVEYYNNDLSKKLMLIIEGMDEKGRLVYIEKLLE